MTRSNQIIKKIPVGILGATGMVGQNYIKLLHNHPWFKVTFLAASSRSAGQTYQQAVEDRWQMNTPIPKAVKELMVHNVSEISKAHSLARFVFSALELEDKNELKKIEMDYAKKNLPVISNASAHRWTPDIPMLIPEINADHVNIIPYQKKHYGFNKGFIAVKPNCSLQSYLTPIYALIQAGFKIDKILLTTMQAVSGAGYPGVPSLDMIDNLVPHIGGEEEKTEEEPLKILGSIKNRQIHNYPNLKISAHCNRVPVQNGHTACVSVSFKEKIPTKSKILEIWNTFQAVPQKLSLPSAPKKPIIYKNEIDRPQPLKDRHNGRGMAVTVGRLRKCKVFDYRFTGLSHNTIRGAAGGGILNSELLLKKGFLQ